MPQTIKTLENVLKEHYLPIWNNRLTVEPSAFWAKVKKVPLASEIIVAAAPKGLSGGFGFGEEGQRTPMAGGREYERFKTSAKDMYVDVCFSVKTTKLAKDKGAMVDGAHSEIEAAYETAKWNVGRSAFGNGTGKLAKISAMSSAGNTASVDDTKFLKEGLIVDFYADGAKSVEDVALSGRRIKFVDRANKTITFTGTPVQLEAGFVTVQNSLNREITGLGAIFDDSIDTVYGVSKTSNPLVKPVIVDCENDISDTLLISGLRESKNYKNGDVNMLLCGNKAYDAYVEYLRTSNVRVESMTGEIEGGWKAIKYLFGNKEVAVVNEEFVPEGEIFGVNSEDFEFHSTDWSFAAEDGGIFNLMENQSLYRALLTNYGDLICKNTGACIKYKNVG